MKKILTLIAMAFVTMGTWAQDTWTVVGAEGLTGSDWKTDDTSNDMVSQGSNVWKWEKENVLLRKTYWYGFKVIKNHAYSNGEYPSSNWDIKGDGTHFSDTGYYTVTITFNDETKEIGVTLNRTDDVWTIAGIETLTGSNWNSDDLNNLMTKQSGNTYQLTKNNVTLSCGTYQYKVCKDLAWDTSYGKNGGSDNAELYIPFDGTYNVTFTFDNSTTPKTVSASAVATALTNAVFNEGDNIASYLAVIDGSVGISGENCITVNRTLHAGHWNTICLPFFMSFDNLQTTFGSGWKLAKFTGCEGNTMKFEAVYSIDHNTPYLLWVPETKGDMSTFTVTYNYINHDNDRLTVNPNDAGYKMIGTLAPIDALESGKLFIANDKVYKSTGSSKMKAMSAYFEVPASSGARSFTFEVDGETTGIVSIDQDGSMSVNENVFDLQGRRVVATKHGLYIVNGKKIIK